MNTSRSFGLLVASFGTNSDDVWDMDEKCEVTDVAPGGVTRLISLGVRGTIPGVKDRRRDTDGWRDECRDIICCA